ILAEYGIPFEHCPTGIDTMSVVVQSSDLKPRESEVLSEIQKRLEPEVLLVEDKLAMLAVVGRGLAYTYGVAAAVFRELADNRIDIRMIDQGSSGLNIIIGVDEAKYEEAVRACYRVLKSF
ncbi:MAG: ACT domain-containing protein, partial [Firmicutes bacterium]|nr:ACT domain-containing protein [Bacillota bacterium]